MSLPVLTTAPLHICRSCRRALLSFSPSASARNRRPQPSPSSQTRQRPFSHTSTSRAQTLPHFPETKSSELNDLLSAIRSTHLLSSLLAKPHRNLVYKPKNHAMLRQDPGVNITLADGEMIRLQPWEDLPKFPMKKPELQRYLDILTQSSTANASSDRNDSNESLQHSTADVDNGGSSPTDPTTIPALQKDLWTTLVPLLSGFSDTTSPVSSIFLANVTRKAGETGNLHHILKAAEAVDRTGFTLANENVTRELMLQCHLLISRGMRDVNKKMVKKGWGYAKFIVTSLLERESHCGRKGPGKFGKGEKDLRGDLWIVGGLFEACVAKTVAVDGGKDEAGLVAQMAKRVLGVEKAAAAMSQHPGEKGSNLREGKLRVESALEWRLPLLNGLRLALDTEGLVNDDGEGVRKGLERLLGLVDREVQGLRVQVEEKAEGKKRRALEMLKDVEQKHAPST